MSTFQPTATSFRQGARTLPREYYTSDRILDEERESLFSRHWNCIGRASALQRPGDYVLGEAAGESIIVLRDRHGVVRAFFNVCRHRGTRLCEQPAGHFSETIQCPYHAWTYMTDGRLIGAPHMGEVEGFDKADYPLHAAAIAEWEGFLFVHVGDAPQPFADAWGPMIGRLERFNLAGLQVGHRVEYEVGLGEGQAHGMSADGSVIVRPSEGRESLAKSPTWRNEWTPSIPGTLRTAAASVSCASGDGASP